LTGVVEQLRGRLAEIIDLRNAAHLLEWDQQTMMPQRGAATRAEALATLERISHDMFVSDETGSLLEAARGELDGTPPDSDETRLVRVTTRRWEKARRVPTELAAEIVKAGSIGREAWVAARARSDYQAFVPHLERNLTLARRYVDCFDGYECAYDVLLDDYEPGMRTAEVARLFAELKAELTPLIATLAERSAQIDDSCLHAPVPTSAQRELVSEVVRRMGFDPSGWRLDDTVHPFATSSGRDDVRITTRWDANFFPMALYGAMHECGHGLYEAGISHSACTSRRAACGRTWLGAGRHSVRCSRRGSPSCSGVSPGWIREPCSARSTGSRRRSSGLRQTRSPTGCTS
jgi:carboxypeptidase Taq